MDLLATYQAARRDEVAARMRRAMALRAMIAMGASQHEVAEQLGISQSAVSQQLRSATVLETVRADVLLEAAAPVLKSLVEECGFGRLAVFGSVARGEAGTDSDIDLLIDTPAGTSSFEFVRFKQLIEAVLGREVDLVSYGGLKPGLDDDVHCDALLL